MGWRWALIWVWLGGGGGGRLFEVGANSRLGAYSNKYGICFLFLLFQYDLVVSLCNQQKQVIFILVIQLSKQTAPKYASGTS